MFKLRIFQGKELHAEKRKDYRNVVLMQVLIIVPGLALAEFWRRKNKQHQPQSSSSLLLLCSVLHFSSRILSATSEQTGLIVRRTGALNIKNIVVTGAVWSNLFVVLTVGILMGLPRPPKPENITLVTP